MRKFTKKQYLAAGAAAVIIAGGAGAAFAYWTSTGSGTGSASTGTSTSWAVTTDAADGDALTPGGPTDTITFHIQNNSSGVQHLNAVQVTVANNDGTTWDAVSGCSAADYSVGTPDFTAGDVASGATVTGTVTISMNNLSSNQDGCQNATVPLYVAAS